MKGRNTIQPPGWAQKFLAWYCKPELLEDLEGDLQEYFERNVDSKGIFRARIIYIADVFKFMRSYTVRKPSFVDTLIHYIMLRSYIRTSGRNIVRNKLFSSINIIGLAISMSVGLLMISMLSDVLSFDRFHTKHDRIFRVVSRYEYNHRADEDFHATTSMLAARSIKKEVTGIEDVAVMHRQFSGDFNAGEKTIPLSGLMADESFFNVFSFELIQGNAKSALSSPFTTVLTAQAAQKLFNTTDCLGKTVRFNEKDYTVTGILQDVPKFSHFTFEILGSLSSREVLFKDDSREMSWDNMWSTYCYLLAPPDADLAKLRTNLNSVSAQYDKTVKLTHIQLDVEPMDGIIGGENRSNQLGPVIGSTVIKIFAALAFIVLLSACFNYTNMSVARSFKRSKEVGIRKTIGALRSHVASQFIVESILISLLALCIAFIIFLVIRPHFLEMEYSLQTLLALELTPERIVLFILFAIAVGFFAGLVPALFFSRLNAVQVLKNISSKNVFKGMGVRKLLIVFQYTVSIILITGTSVIYKQYKHFIAYDLGFSTANIINVRLQDNKASVLEKELAEIPEVKAVSGSAVIMSIGNYYGANVKYYKLPGDSAWVWFNMVNEKYISLHDIVLVAGKNFTMKAESAPESEVIVNKHVLKRFNISESNPHEAIGEMINVDGKDLNIIGVVDDFEYGRANSKTQKEVILRYTGDPAYLNLKIESDDWLATRAKIETIWKKVDNVHSLDARFYSDQIEESFQGLEASIKLGGFIAFLVIAISSIGLLGMIVYATETRMKEVSVRKILGASEAGILFLLGRGFLILLGIATAIAVPVTYIFFDKVMFPGIANHAPLGISEFAIGVGIIVGIALMMIGSQVIKVARTNPAEVLKIE